MSRRKQSNPKPLKRPEDEDEENDVDSKMDQLDEGKEMDTDQSQSPLHDQVENEAENEKTADVQVDQEMCDMDDDVDVGTDENENSPEKIDNEANEPQVGEMSPRRLNVMKRLKFPADLLTLRQVDETEFLQTGIPWSVTSLLDIAKGTTIGHYHGETVALSSIKPGELVLQFQSSDGEFSFIKVTEETGAWLSLLRPADHSLSHNTCVYFEGGKIRCKVVEDLQQGTELLASFTANQSESYIRETTPAIEKLETPGRELKLPVKGIKKQDGKTALGVKPQPALIYGCPFCGVRFSSMRTLDAHLTYYCSKKPPDFVNLQEMQQRIQLSAAQAQLEIQAKHEEDSDSQRSSDHTSPKAGKRTSEDRTTESADTGSDSDQPRLKSPKTGEIYKCKSCNYVTERLSRFQRHRAAHMSESESGTEAERMSVSPACQDEMFCKACKIQFSSMSTYKGHKEFYCHLRQTSSSKDGENLSELASPGSIGNDLTLKNQLLAVNGPIHPSLVVANQSLLHSPIFLQELLAKTHHQAVINKALAKGQGQTAATSSVTIATKSPAATDDQPLDLSKSSKDPGENASSEKSEMSAIKCERMSPSDQLSPVAKRQRLVSGDKSPESASSSSASKTPLNIPALHPSILMPGQIQYVNKKPIPPLQSISRCVECNIVFYKHENFLIHKEHYCSGRHNHKDSSSSDSDNQDSDQKDVDSVPAKQITSVEPSVVTIKVEKVKLPADSEVKGQSDNTPTNEIQPCYRFFCIPCKIKFSSAGTLKAHKEFYCPDGKLSRAKDGGKNADGSNSESSENTTYSCENCKCDFNSARLLKTHICMGDMSNSPLPRCMYCDYITQTENRLADHMKVHYPTKAFKCNLCGYRGNTARGMRMHGKMHIENQEEFTDENMIEYEEPPLVPIQRNNIGDGGPVDMEAELIRMKNEPYKRRRSRKSFEKSENMVPFIGQSLLAQVCAACGQRFTNVSDFVIHLRMHEIAALEAMKNLKSLRCEHCTEYVADSLTNLLVHMQTKHPDQLPGTSNSDPDRGSDLERSRSCDSQVSHQRSRSCSVESSKTNNSISSRDTKSVNVSSNHIGVGHQNNSNHNISECDETNGDDTNVAGYVEVKVERNLSDSESEYVKSPPRNKDLQESVQSHQPITQATEDNRSNQGSNDEDFESKSSPGLVAGAVSSPSNQESDKSPQQQQISPSQSIKSEPKSPSSIAENHNHSGSGHSSKTFSGSSSSASPTNDAKLSPKLTSPDPKTRYLMNIKQEQMSPPLAHTNVKKSPPPLSPKTPVLSPKLTLHSPGLQNIPLIYNPAILGPYPFPAGLPLPFIPATAYQPPSPPAPTSPVERTGRKYCKHCDINFTYLSSFLTHKKYYCSARNTSEETESATATA